MKTDNQINILIIWKNNFEKKHADIEKLFLWSLGKLLVQTKNAFDWKK